MKFNATNAITFTAQRLNPDAYEVHVEREASKDKRVARLANKQRDKDRRQVRSAQKFQWA